MGHELGTIGHEPREILSGAVGEVPSGMSFRDLAVGIGPSGVTTVTGFNCCTTIKRDREISVLVHKRWGGVVSHILHYIPRAGTIFFEKTQRGADLSRKPLVH